MTDRDAYEVLQVHPEAHQLVVRAAYRALASLYHPDRDASDAAARRMVDLNIAYAQVRSPELRSRYDRDRRHGASPSEPSAQWRARNAQQRTVGPAGHRLDFGRYAGWTVDQLVRHDPDYLRWLARHSSGIRFRSAIAVALGPLGGINPSAVRAATR